MPTTSRIRTTALMSLIGIVLTSVPAVHACAAVATSTYRVTVIGPFGEQGRQAIAMNSRGHVTGQGTGSRLFLYDGSLHLLGKPAGSQWAVTCMVTQCR